MEYHRLRTWSILPLLGLAAVLLIGSIHAHSAPPIYSYMDDRGNLVATDRWEDVPERYRARVKVTEGVGETRSGDRRSPMAAGSTEQTVFTLVDRLPAHVIPGLSTYQSVMLIGGFLGMLLFYGGAHLTGSPFLRLLMPWAVAFIVFVTVYAMFVSDLSDKVAARWPDKSTGSLVHRFNEQGKAIGEKRQERLKTVDDVSR